MLNFFMSKNKICFKKLTLCDNKAFTWGHTRLVQHRLLQIYR